MINGFFTGQRDSVMNAYAASMGCDPSDFAGDRLTMTAKPESYWPFVAMIVGFGVGTVACVEASYLEWLKGHAPPHHERAGYLVLSLVREAATRGETLHSMPPMLGWALADPPADQQAPSGYRLNTMAPDWMREWQAKDLFQNALGQSVQLHRTFRNQFAAVLFDEHNEPAAVAGAFDTAGLLEIGVDVAEAHRGRGLAPVVVTALARAILNEDKTPLYVCDVTNMRSQRTALSSGFLPTLSLALAMPAGVGLAEEGHGAHRPDDAG